MHDQQGVRKLVNQIVCRSAALAMLVVLVAGCTFAGGFGTPPPGGSQDPLATSAAATDAAATEATAHGPPPRPRAHRAKPTPTRIAGPRRASAGTDGRLTILLLGVDSRGKQITGRTDSLMFVTIDPKNGRVAMASVPRDMVQVPIGPGRSFGSNFVRINALYLDLAQGVSKKKGLQKMVKAMEYMAGIEIDRYAMIGFEGVRHLVGKIGGVDIRLSRPLVDRSMHVVMNGKRGLVLKKGKNHLTGPVALSYARTRHTDNDYERAAASNSSSPPRSRRCSRTGPGSCRRC